MQQLNLPQRAAIAVLARVKCLHNAAIPQKANSWNQLENGPQWDLVG
jgi:hypothetical protein